MELYVLGTGRQMNKKRIHNTAFVLDCGNKWLIDCPWALAYTFEKCGLSLDEVERVIITHAHYDHVGGLEVLLNYKDPKGEKIRLYTTRTIYEGVKRAIEPSIRGRMDCRLNPYYKDFEEHIELVELKPRQWHSEDGINIIARENVHPIPAIGLKISDGKRTFAYSGDTKYDSALLKELYEQGKINDEQLEDALGFLWNADFIVHEADEKETIHTNINRLEELPEEMREKIRIAHLGDELCTTLELLEDFKKYKI